jgi:hypothetical protein
MRFHSFCTRPVGAALALVPLFFAAWAGCGGPATPLGGPYGGTTNPTPPDTENTSGPIGDSSGGGSGSSGGVGDD